MQPTNVGNPSYFHKVVDCQWACPAHTNVPEYIRLIAQGQFTEAYMVNRDSNVFPGILGRTCDRPCEPACRRGRVEEKPVAICRLKRVAADHRGEVKHLLPTAPATKNGKKVALVGAGPASLTVANDLMPLGYEVTVFEKAPKAGGLMRVNIPSFRLPAEVLDEEIGYIVDMGVDVRYNTPVDSLKALLDTKEYDAVFVGSGAPKGKEMDIPGRHDTDQVFIGIEWLESIHFGHVDSVGKRVIIIGVGNTAMDCCRSAKRLGATDVKGHRAQDAQVLQGVAVGARRRREEKVEILENLQPVRFVIENGVLTGLEFDKFKSVEVNGQLKQEVIGREIIPCDTVVLAIGQDNAFPWIERNIGLDFGKWDMPVVDKQTFMSTRPGVFFGGDAAFGPANIIWAVEHGHQAAISIHNYCEGLPVSERPAERMALTSTKMGLHEWSYSNNYDEVSRQKMLHVDLVARFKSLNTEVELGFTAEQTAARSAALLELRRADALHRCAVHRVRRVPGHLSGGLSDDRARTPRKRSCARTFLAPATELTQSLFVSGSLKQTGRVMVKDENVCLHCGLCAERCPTYAWDMRKFVIDIPYAGTPTLVGV
jgi:NADPH-dependent glutamate synthase beta subunit-like oxidoreductase/NAD-dependent dihydropyrimidine dehydrogenase PreA subunit